MVKLFSSSSCVSCKMLKKYLDSKNIEYKVIDIEEEYKEAKENKIRTLPTLIYGNKRIEGYNPKLLKEMFI